MRIVGWIGAGLEESRLWVAVFGLDGLVDAISAKFNGG